MRVKHSPSRVAEILLVLLMAGLFAIYGFSTDWVFDDAYFFQRYARNILDGHGYGWNRGEAPTDGITSPLWLALVTGTLPLAERTADGLGRHLAWLSTVFGVAFLFVIHFATRALLTKELKPLALAAPLFFIFSPLNIANIATTGMETAAACSVIAVYLALLAYCWQCGRLPQLSRSRMIGLGVLGFLCVLARPEFGAIVLLSPAILLMQNRKDPAVLRAMAVILTTTVGLLAAYALWRLLYFGDLLPQSFYIKGRIWHEPYEDFSQSALRGLRQMPLAFLRDSFPLHLLACAGLLRQGLWRRLLWLWLPIYFVLVYLSTTLQIMGFAHRFYFPFAGALLVLAAAAWSPRSSPGMEQLHVPFNASGVYLATGALLVICGVMYLQVPWLHMRAYAPGKEAVHLTIPRMLTALPEGTRVAATEVGMLGALNPQLVIIDCSGLNDRKLSRGFNADELYSRRPDIITLIHSDYGGMGKAIREHPQFAEYEIATRALPHAEDRALDAVIRVRRDRAELKQLIRNE